MTSRAACPGAFTMCRPHETVSAPPLTLCGAPSTSTPLTEGDTRSTPDEDEDDDPAAGALARGAEKPPLAGARGASSARVAGASVVETVATVATVATGAVGGAASAGAASPLAERSFAVAVSGGSVTCSRAPATTATRGAPCSATGVLDSLAS